MFASCVIHYNESNLVFFQVAINPHARVAEKTFHNNAASCNLRLTESFAAVYGCRLERP